MLVQIYFALSLILTPTCLLDARKVDWNKPISPATYQTIIKQGFSTNWFKSEKPLSKYHDKNIQDIYDRGFRNLRLRSSADLDIYTPFNPKSKAFRSFLKDLTTVVTKCLEVTLLFNTSLAADTLQSEQNHVG